MSNFKTIIVVLAVLLFACYLSIEYSRKSAQSMAGGNGGKGGNGGSTPSLNEKKDIPKSYKKYEEISTPDTPGPIPDVIQDMCHNVPIVAGEDCYKQLYPITLPYVDYKRDHIPPEFAYSPCIA